MTTLVRFAILGASQTADDAATVARAMTRRAAAPYFHTDRLLDGPYRTVELRIEVLDDAADTTSVSST